MRAQHAPVLSPRGLNVGHVTRPFDGLGALAPRRKLARASIPRMRIWSAFAVALAAFVTPLSQPWLTPAPAQAAVSIAYTLDKLVSESTAVVVATSVEQRSEWAELGGSRRIVTYTKLNVSEAVFGGATEGIWVRTLGGVVGRIGQQVSGEATLSLDEKAVIFLTHAIDGAWVVTGMGQGHYPVRRVADVRAPLVERLSASPQVGTLVARRAGEPLAHARLVGRPVSEALSAIRAVKR